MNRRIILLSIITTLFVWLGKTCAQEGTRISRSIPDGVEVIKDIAYIYHDRELLLDLYRPSNHRVEKLPTLIVIRGGGWARGDKERFGPMSAALALRGFAAVCIEYRASGEALFPAAVLDTKSAVKWVKANAEKYSLDPSSIGAIGGSAGAHLAMLLGVSSTVNSLNPSESFEDYKIQAVVGLAPVADFSKRSDSDAIATWLGKPFEDNEELWRSASPISYIDKDSPSILFIHSTNDKVVPFEQSVLGVNKFEKKGAYSELVLIPDAPHTFWNYEEWFTDTMDKAALFFHEQLKH